ncbi:hypothetical protein QE357_000606 [Siphonobacter sp. BAB-5404]|nr:hypothetical protein [Siphonobacter sp. SORGH_AS_0500]
MDLEEFARNAEFGTRSSKCEGTADKRFIASHTLCIQVKTQQSPQNGCKGLFIVYLAF